MKRFIDNHSFAAAFVLVVVPIILCAGTFWYAKTSTYKEQVSVYAIDWQRIIHVEQFKVVHEDTLTSRRATDAYNIHEYSHTYFAHRSCSETEYSTDSKGHSVSHTISYECGSWQTDDRSAYDVNRWVYDHDVVMAGKRSDELQWPAFSPSDKGDCLGCVREGSREQNLSVHFYRQNKTDITYMTHDIPDWMRFQDGQLWTIEINRFEEPQWLTVSLVDKR